MVYCSYQYLAVVLSYTQLWDLSGHLLSSYHGHTGHVRCCVFSTDDRLLATASLDSTVKVEHYVASVNICVFLQLLFVLWAGRITKYTCRFNDETEGSTRFRPRGNYIDTRLRSARVSIGFQGDLNHPVGPEGFIMFILYSWLPIKSLSVLATETVSNSSVRKISLRDGQVLYQLLSPSANRQLCLFVPRVCDCDSETDPDSGIAPMTLTEALFCET